ncbi:hypothetical protein [Photobacterium iliopiscarium]|uniref:hypothetical protein n=1 Tax=Photobacterium iliopiscarium TaxID=56192 RepID=UPI001E4DF52A|nr:hypothetical protein [Photobacterium iliopiscarium]MCD9467053.1 hypothetical protein [Photobacterium iliopiscarium]MCD9487010.1 hypothetical protein [Photobacterium iliopiscarium]MCF2243563.1 hypothetical protein [Photobacterium iliopiscarium]
MKGQDILLLIKLVSLDNLRSTNLKPTKLDQKLWGWNPDNEVKALLEHNDHLLESVGNIEYLFTLRGLSEQLGISKSEVNNSMKRCLNVQLAKMNRLTKRPEANRRALIEFISHGIKYVFPVKPAEITRGIPTTFSAPVLQEKLLSAGTLKMVWPDPRGKEMGQAIDPLYKSVPFAVKQDPDLYSYLALIDAIRMGNARESNLAIKILAERLGK